MYQKQTLVGKLTKHPIFTIKKVKRKVSHGIEDVVRSVSQRNTLSEIVNQKEIRIVGLKRSGNHAIINWIKKQQSGIVIHLNDIPVNENPYRYLYSVVRENHPRDQLTVKYILSHPVYQGKAEYLRREAIGDFVKKDCLLYSYEDRDLDKLTVYLTEKRHDLFFGKSTEKYDLILLRDPFNMLASRIKCNFLPMKFWNQTIIDLWISSAKEYLGETQYLKNNKIVVNYNLWATDADYRKQLSSKLKLEFNDTGINDVTDFGGGSSFDYTKFRKQANEMKFLDRWKNFSDDMSYRKLLDNDELREYSKRIFGHIPGTESL